MTTEPGSDAPRVDPRLEVRQRRRGRRPGDAYVHIVHPFEDEFERGANGHLVATHETLLDRGGWQRLLGKARAFLIGQPISSEREEHERLTKTKALAVFSSDNISSSAYATEEMMRVLLVAGVGAFSLIMPLTIVIAVVLAIVATSYRQTIKAYPHGASSYIVASDNLGAPVGLVAAGALLIDYTLTVAVSVSAGVAAITSIVPALFDDRVLLAVAIVVILTLGNLRGVRESGTIFMAPIPGLSQKGVARVPPRAGWRHPHACSHLRRGPTGCQCARRCANRSAARGHGRSRPGSARPPEARGRSGVERVGANAGPWPVAVVDGRLVAVLEVAAADALELRRGRDEHRGRGALLRGLPEERAGALCLGPALLRRRVVLDVALQVGADRARHERRWR